MLRKVMFTRGDVGCYADGSFGHGHVRLVMASELYRCGHHALASELRAPASDDAHEEDEALEILSAHCTPGISFGLADGELMLQSDEWWEGFASVGGDQ